ncbi:tubulin-binding cofactor C [Brevipalpus obovatus]|uniref:tubulin-binding cofactor C n=1 Tax=Brevipalpus obovatus TaxID=246614 RepID=UPI003D9F8F24
MDRDKLWDEYVSQAKALEEDLSTLQAGGDKGHMEAKIHNFIERSEQLKKKFTDMKIFLPAYNLRKAQEIMNNLRDKIEAKRNQCLPRKRFSFKAQPLPFKLVATSQHTLEASRREPQDFILGSFYGFKDIQEAVLVIDRDESSGKDIQLINLNKCKVSIRGRPCSVSVFKCYDCEIFIGPVDSSFFVNNCHGCKFQIMCHQLRVHQSKSCSFNVHLTSRGIIEDSTNLTLGKFSWTYPGMEEDLKLTSLDLSNNNWDKIDDFNWLVKDKPSPNWKLISS